MKLISIVALTLIMHLLAPTAAQAQRGLGVGAQSTLTGAGDVGPLAGASITYDTGVFHIDGILDLVVGGATQFGIGGQFWYGIHGTGVADLSVGGGVSVVSVEAAGDDDTEVHIQGGLKIRIFLVENVSLHSILGLSFIFDNNDDDVLVLAGQSLGSLGITYFF